MERYTFCFSPNQSLFSQVAATLLHGLGQGCQRQLFLQAKRARDADEAGARSQKRTKKKNHTPEFLSTPIPVSGGCVQNQEPLYRPGLYTRTRNLGAVCLLHTRVQKRQSVRYAQELGSRKSQSECRRCSKVSGEGGTSVAIVGVPPISAAEFQRRVFISESATGTMPRLNIFSLGPPSYQRVTQEEKPRVQSAR